ncbi:MAG TPA: response regulator [Chitinophagaceae bacterium]|nr:response regulator [Chitinophagaceae bacterium]
MRNNPEVEILLVEDNMNDAELTIRELKKVNLANKLIHLRDGAEALDFLFARGEFAGRSPVIVPKVILLDIKMPRVDGIEVLRQIKNSETTKHIPVVMMTSSKEQPDVMDCYRLGVNSYVVKPVEFENFARAVSELGMFWLLLNETVK